MHTRRTFLAKTARASLGLGIAGGVVVPQSHSGVVLAQSVPDDGNLEQLNRGLERVTLQIAQDGLNEDWYQQVTRYMREYATDARDNDRDARLLDGVRTVLDHPQADGQPSSIRCVASTRRSTRRRAKWGFGRRYPTRFPSRTAR